MKRQQTNHLIRRAGQRCRRINPFARLLLLVSASLTLPASGVEIMSEDFASGDGGFTQSATGTTPVPGVYNSGAGTWSFPGDESGVSENQLTSPLITMPVSGDVRIRFDHRYDAEWKWDGVVLQISRNGSPFVIVPQSAFSQNGYNYSSLVGPHVLSREAAFTGLSPSYRSGGFISSQVEAGPAAAGDTLQLRFVGAWDGNTKGLGNPNWELDQIIVETLPDADSDGMSDEYEESMGLDPSADDAADNADSDPLTNLEEFLRGTDPKNPDTDGDGLTDDVETNTGTYVGASDTGTDPSVPDTDGDGLADGVETNTGIFVGTGDTGSDPLVSDSDADGLFNDGIEVAGGGDPNSQADDPELLGKFDFDTGTDGFTQLATGSTPVAAVHNGVRGTWSFAGDDSGISMNTVTSPEIAVPGTGGLPVIFKHRFSIEFGWDGVVLQFSVNGDPFTTVPQSAYSADAPILPGIVGNSALFDQDCFTGQSPGYAQGEFIQCTAEFGAVEADDTVQIRFLGAWDPETIGAGSPNWELDAVAIQLRQDSDSDGMPDDFELAHGLDRLNDDADGNADADGLQNLEEFLRGTNPLLADSDSDGLDDGVESATGIYVDATDTGTDPLLADSDGDGLSDGVEDAGGVFVGELQTGTDPNRRDSDSDRFDDGYELRDGSDPLSPLAIPLLAPDIAWSAERLPAGFLSTWYPTLNLTNKSTISFAAGYRGRVESGATNLSKVDAWVAEAAYGFWTLGSGDSWHDCFGDAATKQNVTWEMVFRPGDFQGNHCLFNTGGNGDGTAITLIGSTLEFRFQDANSDAQRVVVSADLASIGGADEFCHVVAVADVDTASTGTGSLYVNGVLVDGPKTSTGTIDDWDGGDASELGLGSNIPGASPFPWELLTGGIADFNYYAGRALTAEDVARRFERYAGPATPFQITEVIYDAANDEFTLTWNARAGETYVLVYSDDLQTWGADVDDSIMAEGDTVRYGPFPNPGAAGGIAPDSLFFRVEKQ